ncbi:MAG: diacylglycerol kinase family lipid kinase [Actinomycetota bacterium]|nr:diacylglycerol kinase family lipid kinase [Actinomycetota bacterium]
MRVQVVVNCGAGSVDGDEAQRQEIIDAFAEAQVAADVMFARGSELVDAVTTAAGARPDAVVIAGGDGSIGTAAAVLSVTDVPLAVLPLGTFNHFAKDIGMPLGLGEAAAAIAHGEVSRIDLAEVNGHCFVNNSSIGVYPAMVSMRDHIRDERGWGSRAVPVAAWRVLWRFPVRRMTITAVDHHSRVRSPFVFVGNNRYDVGPHGVGERIRIDAGELCAYVADAESPWHLLGIVVKATVRGTSRVAGLNELRVSELTLDVHGHRVLVSLDGESATLRSPLRYRVRPGALAVLAKPAPGATTGSPTDPSGADAQPKASR